MTGVASGRRIEHRVLIEASSEPGGEPDTIPQLENSNAHADRPRRSPAAHLALTLLTLYGRFVSPVLPRLCRFYPTCSVYASQAIAKYGLLRGSLKAIVRLTKCHPFHPGGFDPVE